MQIQSTDECDLCTRRTVYCLSIVTYQIDGERTKERKMEFKDGDGMNVILYENGGEI